MVHRTIRIALAIVSLIPAVAVTQEIRLLSDCGKNVACIRMLFDAKKEAGKLIVEKTPRPNGTTDFRLRLRARLDKSEQKSVDVLFTGYTDGISCTAFGQGTVAVAGFVESHPVVFTSAGLLEIDGSSLDLGCADCAKLIDRQSKKVVYTARTPSWDPALAGYVVEDLSFDAQKNLYLSTKKACVELPPDGMFRVVEKDRCKAMKRVSPPDMKLKSGESVFEIENLPYSLVLYTSACS